MVLLGAATMNFTPWCRALTASEYVPILFTTSPLAVIRSAPTITQRIERCCIR
ncbi:MAG: hypothetical protein MAG794_00529 [Gammaproteobacteria bacterium]|nr:hypothetical protein [Gammaproteobacteria bacterium]